MQQFVHGKCTSCTMVAHKCKTNVSFQNTCFFSKQCLSFRNTLLFLQNKLHSFQSKCFISKQMFHFKTNVSLQNKCFISKQMFLFKTNVSFQDKCFISKQMFHFKTNVSLRNKCLVFKTNVSFLYHESYTTCYALSSFILRLIPSAYNQVATVLPPCFANSALDKFNHIENCYSTFSSDTNENSG